MKRKINLKGLLSMLIVSACALSAWGATTPELVYCYVREGGLLSPKAYSLRVDFDQQIQSIDYAYVQNGVTVASGTQTSASTGDYYMVNIPLSGSLSTPVSNGTVSYGPISLRISKIVLNDGSSVTVDYVRNFVLTDKVTVVLTSPGQAYPGKTMQPLSGASGFSINCTTGSKMKSGVVEVYQDGNLLGTFDLEPFSSSGYNLALKKKPIDDDIARLGIQPGIVTFRVVKLTWLDASNAEQVTEDECLASVDMLYAGTAGKVAYTTNNLAPGVEREGSVRAWFDPSTDMGTYAITFDQKMAPGATAEFEYGTSEDQTYLKTGLPITLSEDEYTYTVDLRDMLLTIDVLTGAHGVIFYDDNGKETDPPAKITLNVRNLKTAIGADVAIEYENPVNGSTIYSKYYTNTFDYAENSGTIAGAKNLAVGKTMLVKVEKAKVTYENAGRAFVEDGTGVLTLQCPEGMLHEGRVTGVMVIEARGGDYFEVYNDIYDLTDRTSEPISGKVIGKGLFENFFNYLVTFNDTNTDSMAYDVDLGAVMIDGEVMVVDLFGVLGDGFDWDRPMTSVTGILLANSVMPLDAESSGMVKALLVPRSASDVETGVPVGIEEISGADEVLKVYGVDGVAKRCASLRDLAPGLYIVNGRKVIVK